MGVSSSCFADSLNRIVALTDHERRALARLEEKQRPLRRGAILQREFEPASELFILHSGLMMSYMLLDDGNRQILRFFYPGDLMGIPAVIYRDAPEALCALSDCVVCPFDKRALSQLFDEHPRLGALILAIAQIERVSLTDRLAMLGRSSAKARVAALLLELRNRLRTMNGDESRSFTLGLTQEEIGDATGLTAVHVNRMLRQLEQEGMISRHAGQVTLVDEPALHHAANYVDRYTGLDVGWLPDAR